MPVADEHPALFIPKTKRERFEAAAQRHGFDLLKQRVRLVASLQIVIGNARAEMVDMVKADVAGKPLQDLRKFVERTALQRCGGEVPVVAAFPVNSLELMLHVEQPDSCPAGDRDNNE